MNLGRSRAQLCSATLAVLFLPSLLQAQGLDGEIRLEVKDPSGAPMQASGRLENLQTGAKRSFQTHINGAITLGSLSSGHYRFEISSKGFATQSLLEDVESS